MPSSTPASRTNRTEVSDGGALDDRQWLTEGEESVSRVDYTRRAIEAVAPSLLDKPVSRISDADVFGFRNARGKEGKRVIVGVAGTKHERRVPALASTINRDFRTLRAALKKARPEYRFPGYDGFGPRRSFSSWSRCRHPSVKSPSWRP